MMVTKQDIENKKVVEEPKEPEVTEKLNGTEIVEEEQSSSFFIERRISWEDLHRNLLQPIRIN